jgi:hypothetical protein
VLELGGISFLAEERLLHFLDGLVIDVQAFYGREAVVAYNPEHGGGCG